MSDDNAALLAQIAALSGAIESHRHAPSRSSFASSSSYAGRGSSRGRGASRGRSATAHKNRSLILHSSTPDHTSSVTSTSSLVTTPIGLSATAPAPAPASASAPASTSSFATTPAPVPVRSLASTSNSTAWHAPSYVPRGRATPRGVTSRGRGRGASSSAAATAVAPQPRQADVRRGAKMGEVIIDGVTFTFDSTGTKLVKSAGRSDVSNQATHAHLSASTSQAQPSASTSSDGSMLESDQSTPMRASVDGQGFVRTKGGNLISAEYAELKKQKREAKAAKKQGKVRRRLLARMERLGQEVASREQHRKRPAGEDPQGSKALKSEPRGLCTYYTKTGQCKRGLSCSFAHDSNKRALCPRALRPGGCKLPTGTCLLSHTPSEHRSPHCVHYLRSRTCRNGESCPYTHTQQISGPDAPICQDFSSLGWCERGIQCAERHTWECPAFAKHGKCETKGCRLWHVIRAPIVEGEARVVNALDEFGEKRGSRDDDDIFFRDDAAALDPPAEGADNARKRRARVDAHELEQEEQEARGLSFRPAKRRARDFTAQKDFIGFDEDEEEEEEESEVDSASDSESEQEEDEEEEDDSRDADEHKDEKRDARDDEDEDDAEVSRLLENEFAY
ncbi:hypothetical protein IE81DRAFT_325184 [Ceraceosorus guamensis]|uniref:C3H1-type domain-containing protein n=1 Tax=Ceraceosorus guamensis TaxID=1522189 RepID=A0A316VT80_9BASI|nr:hypothetical protein IE81DRAFT_325184 [Ceraceosorus guamensis]PWN40797.1 hypothetical protein IE81DRAFT_325184 [Ceraceosorus guamensis]